jgi:hypothetical protein
MTVKQENKTIKDEQTEPPMPDHNGRRVARVFPRRTTATPTDDLAFTSVLPVLGTGYLEPPVLDFMETWEALNAKRGYGWDSNPWVWVIEFERCDAPKEEDRG